MDHCFVRCTGREIDDASKDCNQRLAVKANMRIQIMPSGIVIKAEQLKL